MGPKWLIQCHGLYMGCEQKIYGIIEPVTGRGTVRVSGQDIYVNFSANSGPAEMETIKKRLAAEGFSLRRPPAQLE